MMNTRTCLVVLLVVLLINPADSWSVRKALKKLGKAVKKVGCKALFGLACPAAVEAVGTFVELKTYGLAAPVVEPLKDVGKNACSVRADKCKRSVSPFEIMVPFSDEFSDYDTNGDKLIAYEEFVFVVIKTVTMADPSELREPFGLADANGDGVLDMDEFQGAPFLFAHTLHHQHLKEHIITRETVIGGEETTDAAAVPANNVTTSTPALDNVIVDVMNAFADDGMSANQTDFLMN